MPYVQPDTLLKMSSGKKKKPETKPTPKPLKVGQQSQSVPGGPLASLKRTQWSPVRRGTSLGN